MRAGCPANLTARQTIPVPLRDPHAPFWYKRLRQQQGDTSTRDEEDADSTRACATGNSDVTYLWFGVLAGLAATPHCAGMCGAFPLHLARGDSGSGRSRTRSTPALSRLLLYLLGKTITYAFLGCLAARFGSWALKAEMLSRYQNLYARALGGAMIAFGLAMLGVLPSVRLPIRGAQDWGFVRNMYAAFFRSPGPAAGLLLGVATGFLPCPITISLVAVAAATRSIPMGLLIMVGLGIGTSAGLLFIGLSGAMLDVHVRRISLRAAGVIVVLLGLITLMRPTPMLHRILPQPFRLGSNVTIHEARG